MNISNLTFNTAHLPRIGEGLALLTSMQLRRTVLRTVNPYVPSGIARTMVKYVVTFAMPAATLGASLYLTRGYDPKQFLTDKAAFAGMALLGGLLSLKEDWAVRDIASKQNAIFFRNFAKMYQQFNQFALLQNQEDENPTLHDLRVTLERPRDSMLDLPAGMFAYGKNAMLADVRCMYNIGKGVLTLPGIVTAKGRKHLKETGSKALFDFKASVLSTVGILFPFQVDHAVERMVNNQRRKCLAASAA